MLEYPQNYYYGVYYFMDIKKTEKVIQEIKESKEKQVLEKKESKKYFYLSITGFIGTAICICMGFYKLLVYSNPDSYFEDSINAYVGGDAYNFIINGTHATAYFVLALVFIVFASSMLILDKLNKKL